MHCHLETSVCTAEYINLQTYPFPRSFLSKSDKLDICSGIKDAIPHICKHISNSLDIHNPASIIKHVFLTHHRLPLRCHREARSRYPRRCIGKETSNSLLAPWRTYSPLPQKGKTTRRNNNVSKSKTPPPRGRVIGPRQCPCIAWTWPRSRLSSRTSSGRITGRMASPRLPNPYVPHHFLT